MSDQVISGLDPQNTFINLGAHDCACNPNNELIENIYNFFEAKNIIQETRSISDAYFKASLNFLKKLDSINTEELVQLVHLIKKRTF